MVMKVKFIVDSEKEKRHIDFIGSPIRQEIIRKVHDTIESFVKRRNKASGDIVLGINAESNIARAVGDWFDTIYVTKNLVVEPSP